MIEDDKPNPFRVLGLPTSATKAEIVERGQELYDMAETEEQRLLYRWSREQLLSNTRTRLQYELFEIPDTQYEDPEWEKFVRRYRRNPILLEDLVKGAPPISVEDFDVVALLRMALESLLTVPEANITDVFVGSPFVPSYRPPLEVQDVIFG